MPLPKACPFFKTMCKNGKIFYDKESSELLPVTMDFEPEEIKKFSERIKKVDCIKWNGTSCVA